MQLLELQIKNLRCLSDVQMRPRAGINLILGDNGDGKTSLLEAIHMLSRARSFRGTSQRRLIRENTQELFVFGRVQHQNQAPITMGVARQSNQLRFKLNGDPQVRVLDMLRTLPVQVISPSLHTLLERGPGQRRRFMDWGTFHVEQDFFVLWQRYQRALKQRNASLRRKLAWADISIWDRELAESAERIHLHRQAHIQALQARMRASDATREATFQYQRGWLDDMPLDECFRRQRERDLKSGYTNTGPHRADLMLAWFGRNALETASRGEQKRLVSMLLLVQAQLVGEQLGRQPLLLVDDMAAELGPGYRERFMQSVEDSGMQAFITFLEEEQIPAGWRGRGMFHVKQGELKGS